MEKTLNLHRFSIQTKDRNIIIFAASEVEARRAISMRKDVKKGAAVKRLA